MSFLNQYAAPPAQILESPRSGGTRTSTNRRPWIELYGDPGVVHERDQFIGDYESWIAKGLVAQSKKEWLDKFRRFPEKIVFVPQPGMGQNWGWSPLNPRCWTDTNGRPLYT